MFVFCFIGRKKTGKTTGVTQLIRKMNRRKNYLLDIYGEYPKDFGIKNDYSGKANIYEFLDFIRSKKPVNSLILFEEAAAYLEKLSKKEYSEIMELCQGSRHTNNTVIFVLHSVADLKPWMYARLNFLRLFKTQDFESTLDSKFRKNIQFLEVFRDVQRNENNHYSVLFEVL